MIFSFKKAVSVLLAAALVFGTVAFGAADVDFSEFAVFANAERKSLANENASAFDFSGNVGTVGDAASPAEPFKTQTGKCGENVFWTFYEDTGLLVISGSGDMYNYTESLTNHFSNLWKGFRDKIEEVVIEYGVTSIGDFVFACCSLKKITIPNTVKRIGDEAFIMCALLSEVKIPSSVESIGYYAFTSCESLKKFSVDYNNRYFSNDDEGVLFDFYMSTLICYPAGKTNVSYNIPYSVKTIKTAAFFECTLLEEIVFNYSLTEIQGAAFMNCAGLKKLDLPETLLTIGEEAFCSCISLESVCVPENVEVIDMLAFNNCLKLKSITIPDGVEKIGYVSFDNTEFYDNENNWENGDLYIGNHLIDTKNTDEEIYTIKDGTKVVADCVLKNLNSKTIIIPESVTSIGGHGYEAFGTPMNVERFLVDENNKFYSNDALGVLYNKDKTELVIYPAGKTETSFTIPDSVVSIADYAFYRCDELSDIHIPDSVEKIGNRALDSTGFFKDESNWENGVLYAGKCLVSAKKDISGKYVVKYGTKYICCCAFQACKNLTEIIIPNGVEEIGAGAFSGCSSLEEIILPESVKRLGFALFENCKKLCRVHIPSSVTEISGEFIPFYFSVNYGNPHCFMLSSPSAFICSYHWADVNDTYIANFARENGIKFEICRGYSPSCMYQDGYAYFVDKHGDAIIRGCDETIKGDVVIPTELGGYPVTSIEYEAFTYRRDITSIFVHKNITKISKNAVSLCYDLASIKVDPDNPSYSSDENGVLFNKDKTELLQYPIGNTRENYEIPCTVKRIGDEAFINVDGLLDSEYGESLYSSGYLKNITIPNSVTEIGLGAFAWSNIENIVIPDSVENIEDGAFQGCINLETVTIGKGLSNIGTEVFLFCKSLEKITVDEENKNFSSDENGILFNKDKTVLIQCPNGIKLEQYIVPDTVEEIGYKAFQVCSNLKQIILQDGIKTIDRYAFEGCANLESIYIPKSVTSIKREAFYYCGKLKNIYYEGTREDWSSIEQYQYGLIDENLVRFNSSIDDLPELPEKTPDEEPPTQPDKIYTGKCGENISWTFYEATGLLTVNGVGSMEESTWYWEPDSPWAEHADKITEAVVSEGVTTLSANAFDGCVNLKKVSLPGSLLTIGARAFNDCESLKEIHIPDNVERIEGYAFQNCRSLEKINIPESVNFIGTNILNNVRYKGRDEDGALYIDNCLLWVDDETSATEFEVKEGTRLIAYATFGNCFDTKKVIIPASVQYVSDNPFGYDRLTEITVDPENQYFTSEDNVLFNKDKTVLVSYLSGNPNESYTVPDSVKVIGDYAFLYCFNLRNITLPSGLKIIGDYSLAGTNVENFVIPDTVTSIGINAFAMNGIRSIYIPASVTEIGDKPFLWCYGLEKITVDPSNAFYSNDNEGVLFNKDKTVLIDYPLGRAETDYVVPYTVQRIGLASFNSSNITRIVLPKGLSEIGYGAFIDCDNITDVYYMGSQNEWNAVKIDELNESVLNADIHYNSVLEDIPGFVPEETTEPSTTKPAEVPTTAKPIVTKPSTTKPVEVPTTAKPIVTEPSTTKPVEVSTTVKPIVTKPSTTKPVEVPTTVKPIVTEPSTTKPVEVPTTTKPIVTEPSTTKPVEVPTTAKPTVTEPPTVPTTQPVTEKKVTVEIRKPSQTEIVYGDSIVLHAEVENMPDGAKVIWTADNGNFIISNVSENGRTCVVTPSASGETVFVATLVDADGNVVVSDTQSMSAKAGFFQKIIAFFKKIFGMTKIIPEIFKV